MLEAQFIAWTQADLAYSLISATIPTFQNFLKSLHTGFGGITAAEGGYGYGSASGSRNRGATGNGISYHMSKLRSGNRTANKSANKESALRSETYEEQDAPPHAETTNDNDRIFVGPGASNRSEIAANGETTSINSDESRQMMIRKEVEWNVRTEPRE